MFSIIIPVFILWKICSLFISDKTYTNMHHISDAFFFIFSIREQRHLYIHFMYFVTIRLCSVYVRLPKHILLFWTRMKSMRIFRTRQRRYIAHQMHFKPSNLTIFSSMDLKIHLTQRNEVQKDNFCNMYKLYKK